MSAYKLMANVNFNFFPYYLRVLYKNEKINVDELEPRDFYTF